MLYLFVSLLLVFIGAALTETANPVLANSTSAPKPILAAGYKRKCPLSVIEQYVAHSDYRAKHGSPSLTWDADIRAEAQVWAEKQAVNGSANPSNNPKYGENMYVEKGGNLKGVIDTWYAEVSNYTSYGSEPNYDDLSKWGHFTQLVWKSTTKFGCGCADYKKGDWDKVMFCYYLPPGNVPGEYKKNVFPPKAK